MASRIGIRDSGIEVSLQFCAVSFIRYTRPHNAGANIGAVTCTRKWRFVPLKWRLCSDKQRPQANEQPGLVSLKSPTHSTCPTELPTCLARQQLRRAKSGNSALLAAEPEDISCPKELHPSTADNLPFNMLHECAARLDRRNICNDSGVPRCWASFGSLSGRHESGLVLSAVDSAPLVIAAVPLIGTSPSGYRPIANPVRKSSPAQPRRDGGGSWTGRRRLGCSSGGGDSALLGIWFGWQGDEIHLQTWRIFRCRGEHRCDAPRSPHAPLKSASSIQSWKL